MIKTDIADCIFSSFINCRNQTILEIRLERVLTHSYFLLLRKQIHPKCIKRGEYENSDGKDSLCRSGHHFYGISSIC